MSSVTVTSTFFQKESPRLYNAVIVLLLLKLIFNKIAKDQIYLRP